MLGYTSPSERVDVPYLLLTNSLGEHMTPQDFTYWLQGFVEMTEADTISDAQWKMIKEHLKLTMNKQTTTRLSLSKASLGEYLLPEFDLSKALIC